VKDFVNENKNMIIDENKKIDVLLSALEERYNSIHKIRERVQGIGIWALGLLLGASAWLMQSDIILSVIQKALASVAILVAFIILRFVYLKDLNKGFNSQQRVAARLEKALCLYAPGVFDDSKEPIYPKEWERAGTEKSDGKFFNSTYLLLYLGVTIFIFAILFHGCFFYCLINPPASIQHFRWR
jgi:hypothetical protein